MNKAMKKKWVAALLSGKYRQHTLPALKIKIDNSYCCLGVLCDVAKFKSGSDAFIRPNTSPRESEEFALLPEDVQIALATVNDEGVPFDMIAGLIHTAL